ncbi:MAG: phosphoribosylglycinamide formyltransferase [Chlorobi bacterium]|nr:phosphoribosylglycinamide formyltransferase [Chlorobiota bacterium]
MLHLAVFASGRGSNLESIAHAISRGNLDAEIVLVLSNNSTSGALDFAREHGIPAVHLSSKTNPDPEDFVSRMKSELKNRGVDFIALAGYMKKVPPDVVNIYANRITNIHPALLPAFGGKGMYGLNVHKAVLESGARITGVTVHIVTNDYDVGPIVAQECIPVWDGDTPESLASRVLELEHRLYPEALQLFAQDRITVNGLRTIHQPPA